MLFVLDEFDELPVSLYTQNDIADAFFLSIRSISAKAQFGFILVGSEKMKAILNFQGHELNKFRSLRIDYFSREQNWPEFIDLVRRPVNGTLEYTDEAINILFEYTAGNPYFTKLICKTLFKTMVSRRDSHITESEVHAAARTELLNVESNSFLHFWEDGIVERGEERREVSSRRQKVLLAYADVLRKTENVSEQAVIDAGKSFGLSSEVARLEIEEFVQRQVMCRDATTTLRVKVRFFALWLREFGFGELLLRLSDRIVIAERQEQEEAYVKDGELQTIVDMVVAYRGATITVDNVRRWLRQFGANRNQRLMYTALRNLRYFREGEIRSGLVALHSLITRDLSLPVVGRIPRVQSALISYLDGPGKSGSQYAKLYGEENKIFHERIVEPGKLGKLGMQTASEIKAIIFVDDFLGTGRSSAENITKFTEDLSKIQHRRGVALFLAILAGNSASAYQVEKAALEVGLALKVRIFEPLNDTDHIFKVGSNGFSDEQESAQAQNLAETFGLRLEPRHPLGYGNCQSKVIFERSCPNNCPPVLWKGAKDWFPLFKRS